MSNQTLFGLPMVFEAEQPKAPSQPITFIPPDRLKVSIPLTNTGKTKPDGTPIMLAGEPELTVST